MHSFGKTAGRTFWLRYVVPESLITPGTKTLLYNLNKLTATGCGCKGRLYPTPPFALYLYCIIGKITISFWKYMVYEVA